MTKVLKQKEHIGHWIFVHPLQENDPGAYMCSECKTGDWDINPVKDKVCKFCGARMLPPAQPQLTGHWIDKTDPEWDGEWDDWQCSCCGSLISSMARNLNGFYLYCPKCGAKMEENNAELD